jgi:hypothetical protein
VPEYLFSLFIVKRNELHFTITFQWSIHIKELILGGFLLFFFRGLGIGETLSQWGIIFFKIFDSGYYGCFGKVFGDAFSDIERSCSKSLAFDFFAIF